MSVCVRSVINKITSWPHWQGWQTRGYWVREMTDHFVWNGHRLSSSLQLSFLPSSFPPGVFQNNSSMTIDAEQSGSKITVIKRELQAERSLLCLKGHTFLHKHSNIKKLAHMQAQIQTRKQLKVSRCVPLLLYILSSVFWVRWGFFCWQDKAVLMQAMSSSLKHLIWLDSVSLRSLVQNKTLFRPSDRTDISFHLKHVIT